MYLKASQKHPKLGFLSFGLLVMALKKLGITDETERQSYRREGLYTLLIPGASISSVMLRLLPLSLKELSSHKELKNLNHLIFKGFYPQLHVAALSRVNPAIRDIFDVHYAVKNRLIDIRDMIPMIKHKLDILDRTIDLSAKRKKEFLDQLQENLKPVLRQKDFEGFNFEQAWKWLKTLEKEISK